MTNNEEEDVKVIKFNRRLQKKIILCKANAFIAKNGRL